METTTSTTTAPTAATSCLLAACDGDELLPIASLGDEDEEEEGEGGEGSPHSAPHHQCGCPHSASGPGSRVHSSRVPHSSWSSPSSPSSSSSSSSSSCFPSLSSSSETSIIYKDGDGDGDGGPCASLRKDLAAARGGRDDRHRPRRRGGGHVVWPCEGVAARAGLVALVLVLLWCVEGSWARPAAAAAGAGASRRDLVQSRARALESRAVKYLSQFGYLTGPSVEAAHPRISEDELRKAIKALQAMGNIPQTGWIDRRMEELMSRPRCGNVDSTVGIIPGRGRLDLGSSNRRYVDSPSKWDRKNLTFRILNYTPDIQPLQMVRDVIRDAFALWSNATQLQFIEVMYGNADLMIKFASRYHQDGYPFDGKGMILAHAFYPGVGRGGDTHFDDDEFWTTNATDGVDLFMVAAHEFGHALGLPHSAEPGALMYPWFLGHSGKFSLPRHDAESIQKLYGLPQGDRDFPVSLIPRVGSDDQEEAEKGGEDEGGYRPNGGDDQPPHPCSTRFDAIAIIRSDVFLFFGKWFWRLDSRGIVKDPVHIHKFWYGLPPEVTRIDAVLERQGDKRILFFAGDRYWVFNANRLVSSFPRQGLPITEFGIPADVKRIDTVYTWGFNKRTYLVSGDMYWKLNENNTLVEYDYPRDMSIWRGVPVPLDAAFQYWDGNTYFFKGTKYWKFYDLRMRVEDGFPQRIAEDWLQCSGSHTQNRSALLAHRKGDNSPSSASKMSAASLTLAIVLLLLCRVDLKWQDR
ncbi:matrix metalloproteinase-17-like [Babylonia areolata]|uniref:matrix metalloproteinase-17-like n=1 Tax=Babylonia areolata TaxID=304850 RepID=UPI003FD33D91